MSPTESSFSYREFGPEGLDAIRPMWEKLKAYHAAMSRHFGGAIAKRTFAMRHAELLSKGHQGMLRVDVARVASTGDDAGLCISTVSAEGEGEIDVLFVEEPYRGRGVGTTLMRRALAWLDEQNVKRKGLAVLAENDEAITFYRRFGFHLRAVWLQTIAEDSPES